MSTDRIEKEVVLRAPLERVWRAISDADEFGRWFGVRFDGPFVAGATVTGVITPTEVDEEVAKMQEPHVGMSDAWQIVAVEPQQRLAFRWHPYAVEPGVDYSAERRASAFEANSEGWSKQTELVSKYLALSEKM